METGLENWAECKAFEVLRLLEGSGKRVLDVGCGIGTFSEKIANAGYQVVAADCAVSPKRKPAKNVSFVRADILDAKTFPKPAFDAIVMLDVLEHVGPDKKALANAYAILKPGGTLVLTVPAFPALYSKLDEKIGHFRRYTKRELEEKMQAAGFENKSVFYWNFAGLFGWLFFCKMLGKSTTSAIHPVTNAVLGTALELEKRAKIPIGLTLFAKATKPQTPEKRQPSKKELKKTK